LPVVPKRKTLPVPEQTIPVPQQTTPVPEQTIPQPTPTIPVRREFSTENDKDICVNGSRIKPSKESESSSSSYESDSDSDSKPPKALYPPLEATEQVSKEQKSDEEYNLPFTSDASYLSATTLLNYHRQVRSVQVRDFGDSIVTV
jgi:hypothetical protein